MDVPAELKNLPKPVEKPKMSLADAKEWVTDFGTTDSKSLNAKQQALLAEAKGVLAESAKKTERDFPKEGGKVLEMPAVPARFNAGVIHLTPEMRARLQAVRAPVEAPKAAPQRLDSGVAQHLEELENQWRKAA